MKNLIPWNTWEKHVFTTEERAKAYAKEIQESGNFRIYGPYRNYTCGHPYGWGVSIKRL